MRDAGGQRDADPELELPDDEDRAVRQVQDPFAYATQHQSADLAQAPGSP